MFTVFYVVPSRRRSKCYRRSPPQTRDLASDTVEQISTRLNTRLPPPSSESEIRPFFTWLEEQLGIKSHYEWSKVRKEDIDKLGAAPIINTKFNGSLQNALKWIYPQIEWPPWLFGNVPAGYWSKQEHRREFFDYIGREMLHITSLEDWYKISRNQFIEAGGSSVLVTAYKNVALCDALMDVYPEHSWEFWRFSTAPSRDRIRSRVSGLLEWMKSVEKSLEITKNGGWYRVTREQLAPFGARNILPAFDDSLYELLNHIKPEHSWRPWRFKVQPKPAAVEKLENLQWWLSADSKTMKMFLEDVAEYAKLSPTNLNDWYRLHHRHLVHVGDPMLLQRFQISIRELIRFSVPEHHWVDWLFEAEPLEEDFWKNQESRRAFLEWTFEHLSLDKSKGLESWYNVSGAALRPIGGLNLLKMFNYSLEKILESVYSDHKWLPWKFPKASSGFWENLQNQQLYFRWLGEKLGYQNPEDWYGISKSSIIGNHGSSLLAHYYNNSPILFVRSMMPNHSWISWKFNMVENGFWSSWDNRKAYFDWLYKQLGLESMDDWYTIKKEDVTSNKGAGVLVHRYANCVSLALADVYPDHEWQSWRWNRTPPLYWSSVAEDGSRINMSALEFMQQAAKKLSIKSLDDWYRISKPQLTQAGVIGIVSVYGGLPTLLKKLYPDHDWEASRFVAGNKRSQQRRLVNVLREIFPQYDLIEETVLVPKSLGSASDIQSVQIDVLFPSIHLAFEYQGEHHYLDVTKAGASSRKASVDLAKAAICLKEGITLISVPYWWDGSMETLSNEIHAVRPDLISKPVGSGALFPSSASEKPRKR